MGIGIRSPDTNPKLARVRSVLARGTREVSTTTTRQSPLNPKFDLTDTSEGDGVFC